MTATHQVFSKLEISLSVISEKQNYKNRTPKERQEVNHHSQIDSMIHNRAQVGLPRKQEHNEKANIKCFGW